MDFIAHYKVLLCMLCYGHISIYFVNNTILIKYGIYTISSILYLYNNEKVSKILAEVVKLIVFTPFHQEMKVSSEADVLRIVCLPKAVH